MTREIFTKNIKTLRNRAGLSQAEMAEKVEISLSGYNQIEYGKVWPTPKTLEAISKALGAPVFALFFDSARDAGHIPAEFYEIKGAKASHKQEVLAKRNRDKAEMESASKTAKFDSTKLSEYELLFNELKALSPTVLNAITSLIHALAGAPINAPKRTRRSLNSR